MSYRNALSCQIYPLCHDCDKYHRFSLVTVVQVAFYKQRQSEPTPLQTLEGKESKPATWNDLKEKRITWGMLIPSSYPWATWKCPSSASSFDRWSLVVLQPEIHQNKRRWRNCWQTPLWWLFGIFGGFMVAKLSSSWEKIDFEKTSSRYKVFEPSRESWFRQSGDETSKFQSQARMAAIVVVSIVSLYQRITAQYVIVIVGL